MMRNCSYCKYPIRPYQISKNGQILIGGFNNNSNIGFQAMRGSSFANHLECYKAFNKKIWTSVILGLIFIVILVVLFVFGMINFFESETSEWKEETMVSIIDEASRKKA